jgi:hypothetical protein
MLVFRLSEDASHLGRWPDKVVDQTVDRADRRTPATRRTVQRRVLGHAALASDDPRHADELGLHLPLLLTSERSRRCSLLAKSEPSPRCLPVREAPVPRSRLPLRVAPRWSHRGRLSSPSPPFPRTPARTAPASAGERIIFRCPAHQRHTTVCAVARPTDAIPPSTVGTSSFGRTLRSAVTPAASVRTDPAGRSPARALAMTRPP